MKQFLTKSTILTIFLLIIGTLCFTTIFKAFYLAIFPVLLLFFYMATNLVHAYLLKVAEKSGVRFTSQYTAISFLKMFLYLIVAVAYVALYQENIKPFILVFLILYLVYTIFEVGEYLKVVRQKN